MPKYSDAPVTGTLTATGTAVGVTEDMTGCWVVGVQISGLTVETINIKAMNGSTVGPAMKWTDASTGATAASANLGNGYFYVQAPFSKLQFVKSAGAETVTIAYIAL